mmetsp:Transcript_24189/g.43301  ORF Transcript_24189/g.43301 Transcript_24189/m.43301 type:complete len:828 (+) Transcript_24189:888-3371(+)
MTDDKDQGLTRDRDLVVKEGASHTGTNVVLLNNALTKEIVVCPSETALGVVAGRSILKTVLGTVLVEIAKVRVPSIRAETVSVSLSNVGIAVVAKSMVPVIEGLKMEVFLEEVGLGGGMVHGPRRESKVETINNTHDEDIAKVPTVGGRGRNNAILGKSNHGTIVENSENDNQKSGEVPVIDNGDETEGEANTEGHGNGVLGVGGHALENLAGTNNSSDNGRKTGSSQDNISSTTSGISSTSDGNTDIGLLKSGGIIDTITSHTNSVASVLENLDNLELVLREDLSKTIGHLNHLSNILVALKSSGITVTSLDEDLRGEHDLSHSKLTGSLLTNQKMITSNHLDANALMTAVINGGLGIVARRVEHRNAGKHGEVTVTITTVTLSKGDTKGTETTVSELKHLVVNGISDLVLVNGLVKDDLGGTLHDTDGLTSCSLNNSGTGELIGGVEGDKPNSLVVGELVLLGVAVVKNHINGLLSDNVGGESSVLHAFKDSKAAGGVDGRNINRELVKGKSTGLIRAENIHASHLLDGRHTSDNGTLLGEGGSTKSESDRQDSRHSNGDTTDKDNQTVGEGGATIFTLAASMPVMTELDAKLNDKPNADSDQAHGSDTGHNLLKVGNVMSGINQSGGPSEESVDTGGIDNSMPLTLLNSGTGEADITSELFGGERLAGKGSLIDLHRKLVTHARLSITEELDISRNDITELNNKNITRNEADSINGVKLSITENLGLRSKSSSKGLNSLVGIRFLNITNNTVQKKQRNDEGEISVIKQANCNNCSSLHGPRKRVPHIAQKDKDGNTGTLGELVRTILFKALLDLSAGETMMGAP